MSLFDTVKVVSFDLDDTFWDCAPAIANAENALFDWHRQTTPRIAAAHTAESLLQFRIAVRAQHPALSGCVTAMRLQGLRQLLVEFEYPASLAEEGFDVFYRARSEVELYPGVIELLKYLKGRVELAAITNGNADLSLIGIEQYFDKVYAADLQLRAKPHREMFDLCGEHFSVEGRQILHIGDNPVADVKGGTGAGVQTLWFNQHDEAWPHNDFRPDFEAQSIAEMRELLT